MSEECRNWDSSCHLLNDEQSAICAVCHGGVRCFNLETWKHYPDSPYGDVDICPHGNVREHGCTDKICMYCDDREET